MRRRARISAPAGAAALGLLLACSGGARTVGYDGPLPSPEARATLGVLRGSELAVPGGVVPAGEHAIGVFAVVPNGVTVKSGGVLLEGPGGEGGFLPLLTDGDVADLHRRVRGEVPPELAAAGPTSAAYRRALGE